MSVEDLRCVPTASLHLWPRDIPQRIQSSLLLLIATFTGSRPGGCATGSSRADFELMLPPGQDMWVMKVTFVFTWYIPAQLFFQVHLTRCSTPVSNTSRAYSCPESRTNPINIYMDPRAPYKLSTEQQASLNDNSKIVNLKEIRFKYGTLQKAKRNSTVRAA